jgi:hypothetical protein
MSLIVALMVQKNQDSFWTQTGYVPLSIAVTPDVKRFFPGNEASSSIFQIIFPSPKSVHSSVHLPPLYQICIIIYQRHFPLHPTVREPAPLVPFAVSACLSGIHSLKPPALGYS